MSEQIFPPIGASNVTVINTPLPTEDVSDGTTGNPVPTTAIQVGGSDGTNLQALQVDGSKNLKVIVENTDYSTSTNQTSGNQKTQVVDGSGNIQPSGDTPARSIQVEVTDGTNVLGTSTHPVRTDPVGTTNQPVNIAQVNGTTPNLAQETGGNLATVASSAAVPGAGTAPTKGLLRLSIANDTPPAATNGQSIAAQSDLQGNLRVNPYGANGSFKSQLSNPAAGNNGTLTVPSGKKWVVKVVTATLVTNSTVVNRTMEIVVSDASGNVMAVKVVPFDQAASLSGRYIFAPSLTDATSLSSNGNVTFGFPEMVLGPSWTIKTAISALQPGDTVTLFANTIEIAD